MCTYMSSFLHVYTLHIHTTNGNDYASSHTISCGDSDVSRKPSWSCYLFEIKIPIT